MQNYLESANKILKYKLDSLEIEATVIVELGLICSELKKIKRTADDGGSVEWTMVFDGIYNYKSIRND